MEKLPITDYRKLRPGNLASPQFSHLLYLIYWPLFGIAFYIVERVWVRQSYTPIYCSFDDLIPFSEGFVIPYLFWFVFLIGIHVYTLLFDTEAFKKLMQYIIITYTATIIIYILFPNCQELRPVTFERDNFLTRFMAGYYAFDTNTNVCPSLHVIGSTATVLTAWHAKGLNTTCWRTAFLVSAVLISVSTVFLKQHSIIDVICAVPVCVCAYLVVYVWEWRGAERNRRATEPRIKKEREKG